MLISSSHGGISSADKHTPTTPATVELHKGAWTHEEDVLLRRCIEKYGEGKWHQVPRRSGLMRCRKSCRLRWINYLRPNLKRGDFTEGEVDLILRLHRLLGNKWSLIAGRIPGRTANDVKNYWNTRHRKTVAARNNAGTMAERGRGGASGGAGKMVDGRAHEKSYTRDTSSPSGSVQPVESALKRDNTCRTTATAFTVIKPQPLPLTASIRFALTPDSETGRMSAANSGHGPSQTAIVSGDKNDVHTPNATTSTTPPPEDPITTWWDGIIDDLVPSSGELLWASSPEEAEPPMGYSVLQDDLFYESEEHHHQQQRLQCQSVHQSVVGHS